jgi:hypothetical protein
LPPAQAAEQIIPLNQFISQFGDGLLDAVQQQNPAVYTGEPRPVWDAQFAQLKRVPFEAQSEAVRAACELLINQNQPSCVLNAEMGTGKTMMGIMTSVVLHHAGYPRSLVLSPPHLVYKWRREIYQTVPDAKVWILNGPDTLRKLLSFRKMQGRPEHPTFFILGRVRMRMGFNWKPSFTVRTVPVGESSGRQYWKVAACPDCGQLLKNDENDHLLADLATAFLDVRRKECPAEDCNARLWTLTRDRGTAKSQAEQVLDALRQIPSIGERTADRLLKAFGSSMLAGMLEDNFHNFINLMDEDGDLLFTDRQARRMERFLGNNEVSFGQGGYQPTEFIKRYLPRGFFGSMIVDEGHEYKNEGSAQGQAMGVLCSQVQKTILLTGTLMGGYADDLFYLLYRLNPQAMIEDGYNFNERKSIGPAAQSFLRDHGVLIDEYKEVLSGSHRTAKGETVVRHTHKGPGFGPKGIMRYVIPQTVFLKLKDIGGNVLPPYQEEFIETVMDPVQASQYFRMSVMLKTAMNQALLAGDHTLMGVVINALLAWPDCCFREETVVHPRKRTYLAGSPSLYSDVELMPKERELIELCRSERAKGRRVLVYTMYTGTRDTMARLKAHLEQAGFKTGVLRSTVEAIKREDWLADQVERGVDVLITNPELVKTGLDLLDFPTIVFMQTGYNVYTLMQAARRSWRIGQKLPVRVVFIGYKATAQAECLTLMAKKIAVSQSTSGDMPDSGLDILNQDGDSVEVALAKQLLG